MRFTINCQCIFHSPALVLPLLAHSLRASTIKEQQATMLLSFKLGSSGRKLFCDAFAHSQVYEEKQFRSFLRYKLWLGNNWKEGKLIIKYIVLKKNAIQGYEYKIYKD